MYGRLTLSLRGQNTECDECATQKFACSLFLLERRQFDSLLLSPLGRNSRARFHGHGFPHRLTLPQTTTHRQTRKPPAFGAALAAAAAAAAGARIRARNGLKSLTKISSFHWLFRELMLRKIKAKEMSDYETYYKASEQVLAREQTSLKFTCIHPTSSLVISLKLISFPACTFPSKCIVKVQLHLEYR